MFGRKHVSAAFLLLALTGHAFAQDPPAKPAPSLPFEPEIVHFEEMDAKNPPVPGGIVFVGSSSIRRWTTLQEDFPGRNVLNRGFGGSQTSDSVYYAERIVIPYKPSMVVFFAGTNDIAAGKTAETVFTDYKAFVDKVHQALPNIPILYLSITPAPSRQNKWDEDMKANQLIKDYCKTDRSLKFVDMYKQFLTKQGGPRPELFVEDQLHMNPAGYAIWVKAVTPLLPKPARR